MTDTTVDDWLQARHSNWNTPTNLINEYVRKATGSAVEQVSRVVLGVDNEVYDVTTVRNHRLIVRISHKEHHRFEAERWALHTARFAGVPTPHVLLVEQAEYDGIPVMFCIEEKVLGKPLDMLLKEGVTSDLSREPPCLRFCQLGCVLERTCPNEQASRLIWEHKCIYGEL